MTYTIKYVIFILVLTMRNLFFIQRRITLEKHYFLRDDLEALNESIHDIDERIKDVLQQAGGSCKEGADTWHDNFEYEESQRSAAMWSNRLRELVALRASAQVVTPAGTGEEVLIGRIITVEDCDTKETMKFRVGSYMILRNKKEGLESISYAAPLASMLIGAKENEVRSGIIGGEHKRFKISKIE